MKDVPNALATTEDFEFAALREAQNYRRALLNDFSDCLRGHVLEVGAGIGQITSELQSSPEIKRLVAVEPEDRFCSRLRATFPDLTIVHGTVADLHGNEPWNAILSVNVLEHIEHDEDELAAYRRLLAAQNGALCLFVPARPEIYAPIDRDFGHFRRYTKPALRQKLERAGFRIERLRYYNCAGYFAWWLGFCLLRKREFDIASVRFFDRIIFPIVHGVESRICPPPIGQSLMAVAHAV